MTEPIKTRSITDEEKQLKSLFIDAIAAQSTLMDSLAQRLLMIELAIPSLYVSLLKLNSAKISFNLFFALTFIFWLLAIIFIINALLPKTYHKVNRNSSADIEAFFDKAANYKRNHIFNSLFCFIAGLTALLGNVFI